MLCMPLLKLETTVVISEDKQKALLASLSKAVAGATGKPEQYVMVTASTGLHADVRARQETQPSWTSASIGGLSSDVNRKLSSEVCKLLSDWPWDSARIVFT